MPADSPSRIPHNPLIGRQMRPLNEAIDAFNARRPLAGDGVDLAASPLGTAITVPQSLPRDYFFYGAIVDKGPGGDGDFTDQRYWVRSVLFGQAPGSAPTDAVSAYVDWSATGLWLVASHIAEMSAGSHALNVTTSPTDLTIPLPAQATLVKVRPAQCGGWILETIQTPGVFSVLVQWDGGDDAADNTSIATYTYSLFSVSDDSLTTPIATGLTPERARWNGFMVAADDGTYGLAARDTDGNIILLEAYGEARRTQPCT